MGIRAKAAPAELRSHAEALEAFENLLHYRNMAQKADNRARAYQGGTDSAKKHWARCDGYDAAAIEWEAVLREWLRSQANQRGEHG